ncbi:hypothetical protein WAF17_10885 [Bernardetia sp. ABR2-2B]|uniref:hypothetical protein n=1 Tax=Bernardetia sp. ABR2-2B TaxID=3127472 RepID=UPI0030CB5AD2
MKIYQKNGFVQIVENDVIIDSIPITDVRVTRSTLGILITSKEHNFYKKVETVEDELGNTYQTIDEALNYLSENIGNNKVEDPREFSDEYSDEFA